LAWHGIFHAFYIGKLRLLPLGFEILTNLNNLFLYAPGCNWGSVALLVNKKLASLQLKEFFVPRNIQNEALNVISCSYHQDR